MVAPVSTLEHWERECERWTGLNCLLFRGTPEARRKLYDHCFRRGAGPARESPRHRANDGSGSDAVKQDLGGAWANVWDYLGRKDMLNGATATQDHVKSRHRLFYELFG